MNARFTFTAGLLLVTATAAAAGGIFWTDRLSGAKSIRTCGFDGSSPVIAATLPASADPRGIAVDTRSGTEVYFGNTTTIQRFVIADDGTASVPVTFLTGLNTVRDLRADLSGGWLYYCDQGAGRVSRWPFSGTDGPGPDFPKPAADAYYLDLDASGPGAGSIVWGTSGAGFSRTELAGTGAGIPLELPAGSPALQEMRGICADPTGGWIYWCDKAASTIRRAPCLAGSVELGAVQTLYSNLNAPHGLVLDREAGKLYWVDTGTNNRGVGGRGVNRGDLDGSGAMEQLVVNLGQPWDLDLDRRPRSFADWVARYFRKDAPAATTEMLADPDADGANNLLEMAFGNPPLQASAGAAPVSPVVWTEAGVRYPAVQFRQWTAEVGLIYQVQVSPNLEWTAPAIAIEVGRDQVTDELSLITVRAADPVVAGQRVFMRVKVSLAPARE